MADNKKILIIEEVEDDANLREALHDKLTREGFTVLDAKNGEEGLGVALLYHPDLILLDILMPKMGGLEMLRKLREDPIGKNIPVIIFSNFGDNEKVAGAIALGSNDYLVKSNWTLEEVTEKVKEKLGV
jgi:DNA-binding response OmpR family regulator